MSLDCTENFSVWMFKISTLIIICKGSKKNHKFENCPFVYDGRWGDTELITHQNYHKSQEHKFCCWLGFDVPQTFGNHSGRDGKRG